MLRSETMKLELTQISQRYGENRLGMFFEQITIPIKKIRQPQRKSKFSNLLVSTYEGVWGRRSVPNGGSGGLVPQWYLRCTKLCGVNDPAEGFLRKGTQNTKLGKPRTKTCI